MCCVSRDIPATLHAESDPAGARKRDGFVPANCENMRLKKFSATRTRVASRLTGSPPAVVSCDSSSCCCFPCGVCVVTGVLQWCSGGVGNISRGIPVKSELQIKPGPAKTKNLRIKTCIHVTGGRDKMHGRRSASGGSTQKKRRVKNQPSTWYCVMCHGCNPGTLNAEPSCRRLKKTGLRQRRARTSSLQKGSATRTRATVAAHR